MTAKKPASASYWVAVLDHAGNVSAWMWNCDTCPGGMGAAVTEADAVRDMNAHVEKEHSDRPYAATPVPE